RYHALLLGTVAATLLAAALAGLAGTGVFAILGRYAVVLRTSFPNGRRFAAVLVQHVAGVDLAVGIVPFAGAVIAGVVFARGGFRGRLPFAAVAMSLTFWL